MQTSSTMILLVAPAMGDPYPVNHKIASLYITGSFADKPIHQQTIPATSHREDNPSHGLVYNTCHKTHLLTTKVAD